MGPISGGLIVVQGANNSHIAITVSTKERSRWKLVRGVEAGRTRSKKGNVSNSAQSDLTAIGQTNVAGS